MRWKTENEGFNTQKKHGYCREHPYSRKYQALKNHYYLIQTRHMIGQFMEAWEWIWEKSKTEFRAETQENTGIHERDAAGRIQGRNEEDTDTFYIE
ncbi:MAG: hypothetical protein K2O40_00830 [Lachnospiraceae bacterium]|nr:hypothetical protein [Lachnospiraceae bacterium]